MARSLFLCIMSRRIAAPGMVRGLFRKREKPGRNGLHGPAFYCANIRSGRPDRGFIPYAFGTYKLTVIKTPSISPHSAVNL